MSACARVRVFSLRVVVKLYFSNESAQSIKTPAVHVRCGLTTQSTMFSHVGILALLSWNFTGNVFSKFAVCLII